MKKTSLSLLLIISLVVTSLSSVSFAYAAEPIIANPAKNKIVAPANVQAGKAFTLILRGDRDLAAGQTIGDTKYFPFSWECNDPDGNYQYILFNYQTPTTYYSKPVTIKKPGKYRINALFHHATYRNILSGTWLSDKNIVDRKAKQINVRGKLTFNANKGKLKKSKRTKILDQKQKIGKLPKPTRKGYKFKGWYTKKKGGSKIKKSTRVNFKKANKVMYAQWKKK